MSWAMVARLSDRRALRVPRTRSVDRTAQAKVAAGSRQPRPTEALNSMSVPAASAAMPVKAASRSS